MPKRKDAADKPAEPVWWRWKAPQIRAARREPEKYARELAEMDEYFMRELAEMGKDSARRAAEALAEMEASPAMQLWRQYGDLLRQLPALKEATLGEALDTAETIRSHAARKAAAASAGKPRASRHASKHPEWMRVAKQAAARHPDGTTAARKRKITAALVEIASGIPRRTLATFVASRWRDISAATPRR